MQSDVASMPSDGACCPVAHGRRSTAQEEVASHPGASTSVRADGRVPQRRRCATPPAATSTFGEMVARRRSTHGQQYVPETAVSAVGSTTGETSCGRVARGQRCTLQRKATSSCGAADCGQAMHGWRLASRTTLTDAAVGETSRGAVPREQRHASVQGKATSSPGDVTACA